MQNITHRRQTDITVITVCRNAASTIEDTLLSLQKQQLGSYTYEHLIIDGASTDSTLEIINRIRNDHCRVLSEPDRGLYDAMNKGIRLSNGRIIAILNADDIYVDEHVLRKVIHTFDTTGNDCVYGQVIIVDVHDPHKQLFQSRIIRDRDQLHRWGNLPSHPAFFVRKTSYDKYGTYDTTFDVAADMDLLHRFLLIHRLTFAVIPEPLTLMRFGGFGNTNRIRGCLQCCQSRIKLRIKYTFSDLVLIAGTLSISLFFRTFSNPFSEIIFRKWLRPSMKFLNDTIILRSTNSLLSR